MSRSPSSRFYAVNRTGSSCTRLYDFAAAELLPLVRLSLELGQAPIEAVRDPNVAATQRAHELHVVVAGHGGGGAVVDHVAGDPEAVEDLRAAVDEVADEYRLATSRVRVHRPTVGKLAVALLEGLVAEQCEQLLELGGAAVD